MDAKLDESLRPSTTGLLLHGAARYDLLVWLVTLGRERVFREKVLRLARLKPGESMLDVGCGTGTLAIAAKRHVGPKGTVYGIDASTEMIARASKKARKAGVEVVFQNGLAEALPFPDAQFDAVLSTVMLHHLPPKARQQCACETRRVLKPGGRVLAVDFGAAQEKRSLLTHIHRRHGHVSLPNIIAMLREAGLNSVESGAVGIRDLQFVLATAPGGALMGDHSQAEQHMKTHGRPRMRPWMLLVGVIGLVAGHSVVLYYVRSHMALSSAMVSGVIGLVVVKHLGLLRPVYARFRRRSATALTMTPRLRKFALTAHVTFSVGWLGAVAGFLVLSIAGLTSHDAEVVRGAYLAMNLLGLFVIVPMSLVALATGLVQALGTDWGLLRHYWVLVKLLLTIFATGALLLHQFTAVATAARRVSGAAPGTLPEVGRLGTQLVGDAGFALLVLLVITTLSVFKPWGRTRYGLRKQRERRESATVMNFSPNMTAEHGEFTQTLGETPISIQSPRPDADNERPLDGLPTGLKIFLAVVGVMVVGFVALYLTGHGLHGH